MSRFDDQPVWRNSAGMAVVDEGLRTFMLRVYNYMGLGLGITGLVAYLFSQSPELMSAVFGTGLRYVFMFAPFALVMYLSFRIDRMASAKAQLLFWVYAGLMGISLSMIFMIYTASSIASTFLITSSLFGAMSLIGYTTRRDLTSMGSFMMMGLFGIIIASVVNMFMQNSMMQMMISFLAVIIFTGLTAYDTQKIKEIYLDADDFETANKKAVLGALTLYLDFINIFIHLLQLFGSRRD